jgi:purine-nucleoside/S-methyl-5'-thioadenosine phosphorylase / adenosine deaminase
VELRDNDTEWRLVAGSLGVPPERLLLIHQVHGTAVAVRRKDADGTWTKPEADIIITDDPHVAIGVRVADCAPILLYDRRLRAAGAVHAGWRGAAARAARVAVGAMVREFGTDPRDLTAVIGPTLDACCGEVGPDVVDAFRSGGASEENLAGWFTPGAGDRSFLDLPGANRDQLIEAGVQAASIFTSGLCTRTHYVRLHSYRAERTAAGRMLGAIRLP